MGHEVGDRVAAVLSASKTEVQWLGAGVYDGHVDHPDHGIPNPRITLDSGDIIWGMECWWGPEDKMRAKFLEDDRTVIEAKIERKSKDGDDTKGNGDVEQDEGSSDPDLQGLPDSGPTAA